jgi:hypothetical protein
MMSRFLGLIKIRKKRNIIRPSNMTEKLMICSVFQPKDNRMLTGNNKDKKRDVYQPTNGKA